MQRSLFAVVLLAFAAWADAQTIQITTPTGTCTYQTGSVKSDPNVAGQLVATSPNTGSGLGCAPSGTGGVSFGPASVLTPATQTLPNNAPSPATLGFTVVNATSCQGTITGPSGGVFTGGTASKALCSGSGCNGPQSISTTFQPNTGSTDLQNTVSVTCTGSGGSQAISTATVTVSHTQPPPPPGCASFTEGTSSNTYSQLTSAFVNWSGAGSGTVDTTLFSNIWKQAWPGQYGLVSIISIPTTKYVSAQFQVPANYMTASNAPNPLYGKFQYEQTGALNGVTVSMTISTKCGDFSNPLNDAHSSVVTGCYLNAGGTNSALRWASPSSGPTCELTGGTTYYLNIVDADITNVTSAGGSATSSGNANCSGGTCTVPVSTGHGTWFGYTPQ